MPIIRSYKTNVYELVLVGGFFFNYHNIFQDLFQLFYVISHIYIYKHYNKIIINYDRISQIPVQYRFLHKVSRESQIKKDKDIELINYKKHLFRGND